MDFLELGNARVELKCPVSGRIKSLPECNQKFNTQDILHTRADHDGGKGGRGPVVIADLSDGVGVACTMGIGDELAVGRSVAVISQDLQAIEVAGRSRSVPVAGFVNGAGDGIYVNGTSGSFAIIVAAPGVVQSDAAAIGLQGEYISMTATNHGTLVGRDGVYTNAGDARDIRLVNTGSIRADRFGVILNTDGDHVVINTGRIVGGVFGVETCNDSDILRDSGVIVGGVSLLEGNDLYDGRGGVVFGFMGGQQQRSIHSGGWTRQHLWRVGREYGGFPAAEGGHRSAGRVAMC